MPLVDDTTEWVIGWAVGYRPNTELALKTLTMALATLADAEPTTGGTAHPSRPETVYTGYR